MKLQVYASPEHLSAPIAFNQIVVTRLMEEYEEEEDYEGKFNDCFDVQEPDDGFGEQESSEEKEEDLQEERQQRRRATPRRRSEKEKWRRMMKRRRCPWKGRTSCLRRRRGPNGGGQRKRLDTVPSPSLHLVPEKIDTGPLDNRDPLRNRGQLLKT